MAIHGFIQGIDVGGGVSERILLFQNIHSNTLEVWTKQALVPTARRALSAVVADGKIYTMGGAQALDTRGSNVNQRYDPVTNTWSTKAAMPTPVFAHAAAVVDGKIYVIGGATATASNAVSFNQCYDPVTNTWSNKAAIPTARLFLAAAVVDGKIYTIGGGSSTINVDRCNAVSSYVECYDPVTNTWSTKADMPTPYHSAAAVVVDGKIYVIGGGRPANNPVTGASNLNQCYDPVTNTWSNKTAMPTPVFAHAAVVMDGKIYAIGGGTSGGSNNIQLVTSNANQCYDPEVNTWSSLGVMPVGRRALAAAVVGDKIYVIGGGNSSNDAIRDTERYDIAVSMKQFPVLGQTSAIFNRIVKRNKDSIAANMEFSATMGDIISFINDNTSGTITEKIESEVIITEL